ncbi:hypothetical protein Tco_1044143 [Tanacetum coccineum]|uniref:Uncharacterized protein n=1 Tax=Tanacetum coccineum TaxID=301880 RepID=A0ABQ5GPI3_9ASTR
MDEGTKNYSFKHIFAGSNLSVLVDKTKSAGDGLKTAHTNSGANEESRADDISLKVKLENLSDILNNTRFALFTPDSPLDEPIIVSDDSEEEGEVAKDKDTKATSHDNEELEQAKAEAEVASMKAKPSYLDINQLTELLVTSLKSELSKLLASHYFASCLPTELKELPSKIIGLSREIKELKKHVAELKNIQWELPTEFLNFPRQVSLFQEKLMTLDSLPSLLHKVTDTLNRFATMVENASGAISMNVPSAGKATASPTEGEKNTKDADTKVELVDLLGKNVVTREDGSDEVISNLKVSDLHSGEWRVVIQACLDKSEKGWKTIYDLVLRRLGSIFTSVYAAVQKLKKDSWKELQFSLVDNSKLNVVYLLNRS